MEQLEIVRKLLEQVTFVALLPLVFLCLALLFIGSILSEIIWWLAERVGKSDE